jgi:Fe-S oxidoreductase
MAWSKHLGEIVYSCTGCKNCTEKCPLSFNDNIFDMIVAARGEMVNRASVPPAVGKFLENIQRQGNPYGNRKARRGDWAGGLDIPPYQGEEYLYYVGCVGSFDTRAQETARALAQVLLKIGVSFGVLGIQENCDGNEVKSLGEEALFQELVQQNIKKFSELGIKKIVTLSPHAYNAFRNDYPKFGGRFEVLHYTELLYNGIQEGKIGICGKCDARVTYHDPCFLGRWNDNYDAPRKLLQAIPGIEVVEMERNRKGSLCCGGGGGNFYTDFLGGGEDSPARIRIRQAHNTGAEVVATACPNCLTMLADAAKVEGLEEKIKVRDVAEMVAEIL